MPAPPELRQLRQFIAAAEEGAFAPGARRLGVTPQALAAAIARLERQLGHALFIRHGSGGVELSPAGARLLPGARDVVERADALLAGVRARAGGRRTRLRVGLLAGVAGPLTAPILGRFARDRPDVAVTIHELGIEQVPDVLSGRVDVAIVLPPLEDERVHVEPLLRVPRTAAVPQAAALADAARLRPDDLLDHVFGPRFPWESPAWEGQWSLRPERGGEEPRRLRANGERSPVEQFMRIATGGAVIVLPATLNPVIEMAGLLAVPVDGLAPAHLALARRPDAGPVARAFVASARATARALAGLVPGADAPDAAAVGDPGPAGAPALTA